MVAPGMGGRGADLVVLEEEEEEEEEERAKVADDLHHLGLATLLVIRLAPVR